MHNKCIQSGTLPDRPKLAQLFQFIKKFQKINSAIIDRF